LFVFSKKKRKTSADYADYADFFRGFLGGKAKRRKFTWIYRMDRIREEEGNRGR